MNRSVQIISLQCMVLNVQCREVSRKDNTRMPVRFFPIDYPQEQLLLLLVLGGGIEIYKTHRKEKICVSDVYIIFPILTFSSIILGTLLGMLFNFFTIKFIKLELRFYKHFLHTHFIHVMQFLLALSHLLNFALYCSLSLGFALQITTVSLIKVNSFEWEHPYFPLCKIIQKTFYWNYNI